MGLLRSAATLLAIVVSVEVLSFLLPWSGSSSGGTAPTNGARPPASSFEPRWEVRGEDGPRPYMGNLTCPFEIAHWNLESFFRPLDLERRRDCSRLRYVPREGYVAPDASRIFDRLANGTTIYFIGDSMMCQSGVDFLCLMASVSEVTRKSIGRLPPKNWCNDGNECEVDFAGFTGWMKASATFRSLGPTNRTDIHVVVDIEYGRVGALRTHLSNAKKGDIYVMNQGLHTRKDRGRDFLLNSFRESKSHLVAARERGARLFWRETTAAHFHTADGYYGPSVVPLQKAHKALCVPSDTFDREASRRWDDSGIGALMRSLNVTPIEAWEASFLAPEWCHVGQGIDCAHWLQPGPTSYHSEALLNHLLGNP